MATTERPAAAGTTNADAMPPFRTALPSIPTIPTDPLPCAFKRGRKREKCGGSPKVERTGFGNPHNDFYARCDTCGSSTGFGVGEDGALREWNRWMEMESR